MSVALVTENKQPERKHITAITRAEITTARKN